MSELMCGHMDAEASFNGLDDLNREGPLILSAATRRNEQVSILIGLEAGKDVTPIPAQVSSHMVGDLGNELVPPRLHLGCRNMQQQASPWPGADTNAPLPLSFRSMSGKGLAMIAGGCLRRRMYRLDSEQVLFKWGFPALRLVTFRGRHWSALGSVFNQRPQQHLKETPHEEHCACSRSDPRPCRAGLALTSSRYYVGLDTTTHTCSVVTHMSAGMKMMGRYHSKAAAEKAITGMKECKG
jgi:hypothetical protein